jgi:CshA-type fibril repeat protein
LLGNDNADPSFDGSANRPILTLSITQISFTVGGTLYTYPSSTVQTIPGVGTIRVNSDGTYEFIPFKDWNGTVPDITYTITDGAGNVATAKLKITVSPVNDDPIAVNDDNKTTPEDTPITVNVLTNDSDPDGDNTVLRVTQFTIAGIPGTFTSTATILGKGTIAALTTGEFTFTPLANFNGVVPTITYTVSDGTATNTANFNLTVTPVNDIPVITNETITTPENTTVSGNLLTNDTDVESATASLTITQFTVAGVGSATAATYPAGTQSEPAGITAARAHGRLSESSQGTHSRNAWARLRPGVWGSMAGACLQAVTK